MSPVRWQRKGMRPDGVVPSTAKYVGRPTMFGNLWRLDIMSREDAVATYEAALLAGELDFSPDDVRAILAGKDLVCWCDLFDKDGKRVLCHADVLLRVANPGIVLAESGDSTARSG